MKPIDSLAISHINERFWPLKEFLDEANLRTGWIRYMRKNLSMTIRQLSERANISRPTAAQSEKREVEGKVTLETLKKMAKALECEFVYAFIPKNDINSTLEKKAIEKAEKVIQSHKFSADHDIHNLALELLEKGDIW